MQRLIAFTTAALLCGFALAGCASASHSNLLPPATLVGGGSAPPQTGTAGVAVTITVPNPKRSRGVPAYVSAGTQSIGFRYTTLATKTAHPEQYANVSVNSKGCAWARNAVKCTVTFGATPSRIACTVDAFDGLHGRGHKLGTAQAQMNVVAGTANHFGITLDGVATQYYLQFGTVNGQDTSRLPAGTPANAPLLVEAMDADGNLIVNSPALLGPKGGKVSSALVNVAGSSNEFSVTQNGKALTPQSASTYRIAAPFTHVAVHYGGGLYGNVAVTLSVGALSAQTTLSVNPTVTEYPIRTPDAEPNAMTLGADGNMWFTESTGNNVAKIAQDGTVTEYPLQIASASPNGIAAASDGSIWFTEANTGCACLARLNSDGTIATYGLPQGGCQPYPNELANGPNGQLWFTDNACSIVGHIDPKNPATSMTMFAGIQSTGQIVEGSDGNMWLANMGSQTACIVRVAPDGTSNGFKCPYPNYNPIAIAATPNGYVWYDDGQSALGRVAAADGTIAIFDQNGTSFNDLTGVAAGNDGLLWMIGFDEGRYLSFGYADSKGTTTTVPLYANSLNGLDNMPTNLVAGPKNTFWFIDTQTNSIGKIDLGA